MATANMRRICSVVLCPPSADLPTQQLRGDFWRLPSSDADDMGAGFSCWEKILVQYGGHHQQYELSPWYEYEYPYTGIDLPSRDEQQRRRAVVRTTYVLIQSYHRQHVRTISTVRY